LGFESRAEIGSARLGEPLRVTLVRLDQLRQYQPGGDPNSLLTDTRQLNYPVLVGEQPRAFVVVREVDGKWRTASLGDGGLAKQVASFRAAPGQPAAAGTQDAIVHVAALGVYFLGRRADDRLLLTPLASHPEFNLRAGATLPAEEVFASLVEAAKALRDDAPM
jgi:hypothetical protein